MKYWIPLSLLALCPAAIADGAKYATPKANPPVGPNLQPQPIVLFVGGSDSCLTPDAIAGSGPHAWDNTLATTGGEGQGEAACLFFGFTGIDNDVWFSWTAPSSGTAVLDICNTGSTTVDTKVAIYAGSGCPGGSALACNDDNCAGLQSTVQWSATAGNTYTIQLGCYPGAATGTGNFTINVSPGPINDNCSSPSVIAGNGPHAYDTTFATTGVEGQNGSRCYIFGTSAIDYDVWYTWTATSTGWTALDTCAGGLHDLKIAVYAGSGCPVGEPIICDDDYCGTIGANAKAPFFATAGNTYTFQIGSYPGQAGTTGNFSLTAFTPSPGDDCASPIVISGLGPHNWDNGSGVTGTQGQNEALCANEMITMDIWYRWTSPCTGNITLSLCGQSSTDTKIAAYAGSTCPAGSALACNDDFCQAGGPSQIVFPATAGQNYMLQIGLWPGEVPGSGTFTLSTPCPPSTGTMFCDSATGTACPCNGAGQNPVAGRGCQNSLGTHAGLTATGNPSVTGDTVVLNADQLPASSVLFFQGTAQQNAGAGSLFGDGKRCAGGTVIRLHTHTATGTPGSATSFYPDTSHGDPPVSVRGAVPGAGGVRTYQAWYRNAAAFCTASTFNLSNGLEITWVP